MFDLKVKPRFVGGGELLAVFCGDLYLGLDNGSNSCVRPQENTKDDNE